MSMSMEVAKKIEQTNKELTKIIDQCNVDIDISDDTIDMIERLKISGCPFCINGNQSMGVGRSGVVDLKCEHCKGKGYKNSYQGRRR